MRRDWFGRVLFREEVPFVADFEGRGDELAAFLASRSAALYLADRIRRHQVGPVNLPFRANISYPHVELVRSDVSDNNFSPCLRGEISNLSGGTSRLKGVMGLRPSVRRVIVGAAIAMPLLLVAICVGLFFGFILPLWNGDPVRSDTISVLVPVAIICGHLYMWSMVNRSFPVEVERLRTALTEELRSRQA